MNIRRHQRRRRGFLQSSAPTTNESSGPSSEFPFTTGADEDSDGEEKRIVTSISSVKASPNESRSDPPSKQTVVVSSSKSEANIDVQPQNPAGSIAERRIKFQNEMTDSANSFKAQLERCAVDDTSTSKYDATPVNGFGLSMMRSMGWTGNIDDANTEEETPDPRPERLGLGARLSGSEAPPPSRKRSRFSKPNPTVDPVKPGSTHSVREGTNTDIRNGN